jgi:hypothetical protein
MFVTFLVERLQHRPIRLPCLSGCTGDGIFVQRALRSARRLLRVVISARIGEAPRRYDEAGNML